MRDPFNDPVRQAVARYRERFPEVREVLDTNATAAAIFRALESALVRVDIAMQDEGVTLDGRRRVITAALYGSVEFEEYERDRKMREQFIEALKRAPAAGFIVPASPAEDHRDWRSL